MTSDPIIFGKKIKEERLKKKLSLDQASKQSNTNGRKVSSSHWSHIENGTKNIPKIETLKLMAKGLQISEQKLLSIAGYIDDNKIITPNGDPIVFGKLLKQRRLEKGISITEATKNSKYDGKTISLSYWSEIESGKHHIPKLDTLKRIARGLDVPDQEVFYMAGYVDDYKPHFENILPANQAETIEFPIMGTIKCGSNGIAYEDFQGYEKTDRDDINQSYEYFWLITSGDSMLGDGIKDGDYALIQQTSDFNNGDICAVIVDGEEGMLKHVAKQENTLILSSSNNAYPPRIFVGDEANTVKIVGKLVEIKRKY